MWGVVSEKIKICGEWSAKKLKYVGMVGEKIKYVRGVGKKIKICGGWSAIFSIPPLRISNGITLKYYMYLKHAFLLRVYVNLYILLHCFLISHHAFETFICLFTQCGKFLNYCHMGHITIFRGISLKCYISDGFLLSRFYLPCLADVLVHLD